MLTWVKQIYIEAMSILWLDALSCRHQRSMVGFEPRTFTTFIFRNWWSIHYTALNTKVSKLSLRTSNEEFLNVFIQQDIDQCITFQQQLFRLYKRDILPTIRYFFSVVRIWKKNRMFITGLACIQEFPFQKLVPNREYSFTLTFIYINQSRTQLKKTEGVYKIIETT